MANEGFLSRWSRRKVQAAQAEATPGLIEKPADEPPRAETPPAPAPVAAQPPAEQKPALTMDDVAALTPDSDFSAFVARGVDENVKRSAMKKLFSDPHFNVMDGLDIYIDDYNKFEPIPPAMLAMLNHAKSLLDPLAHLEKQPMRMLDEAESSMEQDKPDSAEAGEAVEPDDQPTAPQAGPVETEDEPDAEHPPGEPERPLDSVGNDDSTESKEARS
jgi:hypothetical protein